jgi:hypothetical protein
VEESARSVWVGGGVGKLRNGAVPRRAGIPWAIYPMSRYGLPVRASERGGPFQEYRACSTRGVGQWELGAHMLMGRGQARRPILRVLSVQYSGLVFLQTLRLLFDSTPRVTNC